MANGTEKLAVLQKVRLLILGGMQMLDPDCTQDGMDEDFFNIWIELQAAWMSAQEAICKIAVKDMEEDRDEN
jgi:hypothetical protein